MIILDTNVISEMMRASPAAVVETWLAAQPAATIFITAVTEAELRYGVALLPAGRRRASFASELEAMLSEDFRDRILPFDSPAAAAYAEIAAERRRAGRPIAQADAQIAAIARSRGAVLATRNVADFDMKALKIVNPWG